MNHIKEDVLNNTIQDLINIAKNLNIISCENFEKIMFKYKIAEKDRENMMVLLKELAEIQEMDGINNIRYSLDNETNRELLIAICKYKIHEIDFKTLVRLIEYISMSSYKIGVYKTLPMRIEYENKKS